VPLAASQTDGAPKPTVDGWSQLARDAPKPTVDGWSQLARDAPNPNLGGWSQLTCDAASPIVGGWSQLARDAASGGVRPLQLPPHGKGMQKECNMGPAIAVVGNINLDVKTGPVPADPRLFRDGETSVAEIYEAIGGGGANTAVAAAMLHGNVTLCGAVGDDALGARLQQFLARHGVTPRLAVKAAPTGRAIALNWEQHQRHFVSCLPSAALLEADDVNIAALAEAGCRHLYRADVWFAPRTLADGNLRWLSDARSRGMQTSIDINWDPHWHAGRDDPHVRRRIGAVTPLLPLLTYVHGNERELRFFAGAASLDHAAKWFFAHGAQTLIVHLGPDGSAALSAGGAAVHVPGGPVDRVVCEAGTGDVFTAAFLLRDGMEMRQRLAECNAVATAHLSGNACFLPRLDG
jgi:sugar/nucleoside kinase (ribokinase family)